MEERGERKEEEGSEKEDEIWEDLEKLNVNKREEYNIVERFESQGAAVGSRGDSDDIFTVKIGLQSTDSADLLKHSGTECPTPFVPHPRMNTLLAVKHGILYMYGGIYEVGDKQLTLSDMYSLDLHKLEEWNVLIGSDLDTKVTYQAFSPYSNTKL